MEYDWETWVPEDDDYYVIAMERVSPDHVIAVQFFPRGKWCHFVGNPVPEHKKRAWERELEAA